MIVIGLSKSFKVSTIAYYSMGFELYLVGYFLIDWLVNVFQNLIV